MQLYFKVSFGNRSLGNVAGGYVVGCMTWNCMASNVPITRNIDWSSMGYVPVKKLKAKGRGERGERDEVGMG